MANKVPVKLFYNTMPGMPQITNQYGDTVNVLDCVLANGTAWLDVSSVTYDGTHLNVTTVADHGHIVDTVIELKDAAEEEYNGEFRITEITGPKSFNALPGTAPAVNIASGTIKIRIAPLGFEIAFTDTNRRAYRSKNPIGTRPYLRVDNTLAAGWGSTYAIAARVSAARTMIDIDTFGDGLIPYDPTAPNKNNVVEGTGSSAIHGWYKWMQSFSSRGSGESTSIASFNSPRSWVIVGDDRAFWYMPLADLDTANPQRPIYGFGSFESFKPGDPYNYFLSATDYRVAASLGWYPGYGMSQSSFSAADGMAIGRDYTGYGYHQTCRTVAQVFSNNASPVSGVTSCIPFPNGPDAGIWVSPRYFSESTRNDLRGVVPGAYFLPQTCPYPDKTILDGFYLNGEQVGKKTLIIWTASSTSKGVVAFDITGPWRP